MKQNDESLMTLLKCLSKKDFNIEEINKVNTLSSVTHTKLQCDEITSKNNEAYHVLIFEKLKVSDITQ